jgi:hypothetical protein
MDGPFDDTQSLPAGVHQRSKTLKLVSSSMQINFGQLAGSTINKMCDLPRCQLRLTRQVAGLFSMRTIDFTALSE